MKYPKLDKEIINEIYLSESISRCYISDYDKFDTKVKCGDIKCQECVFIDKEKSISYIRKIKRQYKLERILR